MRVSYLALFGLLVACPGEDPGPTPVETDETDAVSTDVPNDTGWDNLETAAPVDTELPTDSDTDTDVAIPNDTGIASRCGFGQIADCDGTCYPSYLLGDGTCDDGSTFSSNFHCILHAFDAGDCLDDNGGPLVGGDACAWNVEVTTRIDVSEIAWRIVNLAGRIVYESPYGNYTSARTYSHTLSLSSGQYEFVKLDSFGDGWGGAAYQIRADATDELIIGGTLAGLNFRGADPFELDCSTAVNTNPTGCGAVTAVMQTSSWGGEVSWEIRERDATTALFTSPAYISNNTITSNVQLAEGAYDLVRLDSEGDGWNGATLSLTEGATQVEVVNTTLVSGDPATLPFDIDCSVGPIIDEPTATAPTCQQALMVLHTSSFGGDNGWEIIDDATGVIIASAPSGLYASNRVYEIPLTLGTGAYTVRLLDASGDGWSGGYLEIFDDETRILLAEDGIDFTVGSSYSFGFFLQCPEVIDTAPVEPSLCPEGAVQDCNEICWPTSYLGDGTCDDGVLYAADFFCETSQWDDGDCGVVQ
jgi:hypothetical protein